MEFIEQNWVLVLVVIAALWFAMIYVIIKGNGTVEIVDTDGPVKDYDRFKETISFEPKKKNEYSEMTIQTFNTTIKTSKRLAKSEEEKAEIDAEIAALRAMTEAMRAKRLNK